MAVSLLGQPWCPRFQGLEGALCPVACSFFSVVGFSSMAWRVVTLVYWFSSLVFFYILCSALFWLVDSSMEIGVSVDDSLALDLGSWRHKQATSLWVVSSLPEPVGCCSVRVSLCTVQRVWAMGFLVASPSWLCALGRKPTR
jgi:hypothetical protein